MTGANGTILAARVPQPGSRDQTWMDAQLLAAPKAPKLYCRGGIAYCTAVGDRARISGKNATLQPLLHEELMISRISAFFLASIIFDMFTLQENYLQTRW